MEKAEEEAILNILDAIVANGGQTDNGTFKSRTYEYTKNESEKLLPGTNLKAYPYIEFEIRIWKKTHC